VYKSTLYIATAKTALDEIYPVVFGIAACNENLSGSDFVMDNLKGACPTLKIVYPNDNVDFKYFLFISDCNKGMADALAINFPENHTLNFAFHIQRNVLTIYYKSV
jgi:hypothetical protein